jgi:hypothetical protein
MRKSHITPDPGYYNRYIDLVEDVELMAAFDNSVKEIAGLNVRVLKVIGNKTYAQGKWTIKQILQHVTDWERILTYRTLLIARDDKTVPAGHDQDLLAANSKADDRSMESILDELKIVRASTIQLFKGFDEEALLCTGICWQYEVSVLAMGFMLVGHQVHHLKIIRDQYLNLI